MEKERKTQKPAKEEITSSLIAILNDMTSEWDYDYSGGITPETQLIKNLGFESIDVVQFVGAIEEHFQRKDLPFEEVLMKNGRYVEEILVSDFVEFLNKHL
jgi:acyl carrier protein